MTSVWRLSNTLKRCNSHNWGSLGTPSLTTGHAVFRIRRLNLATQVVAKSDGTREYFQVRGSHAIKNHLFAAIYGYVHLQRLKVLDLIRNCHRLARFIQRSHRCIYCGYYARREYLNPHFQPAVNA